MTNATKDVGESHVHAFSAAGLCGCGMTFEQWREQHEASQLPADEPKNLVVEKHQELVEEPVNE